MKFKGDLDTSMAERVSACNGQLNDALRLEALARTRLMDSPNEEAFDRIASLAARLLKAPLTIISLVGDKKQFFKAGHGLPKPFDEIRQIPIDESICRYTLTGREIIAGDSSLDPLLKNHPTTEPWGIGAFIAIPMTTSEGYTLGAFCAVDPKAREWSEDDITTMRDLTRSVMTEIELRAKVSELEIERGRRERFVAALSHDLRTPLNVVKMAAKILLDETISRDEHKDVARMIDENVNRADEMIRDLLDVSLLKAGEPIRLNPSPFDLGTLARSTVESLAQIHGQRFVLKADGDLMGVWDPLALRRILENLLGNAVKYGEDKSPITLAVTDSQESRDTIHLSVHNNGSPIEGDNLRTLFDPFRRSDSALKGSQRGWGIGLALVRGFTEAHGGSIEVQSGQDTGTIFAIRLPRDISL